MADPQVSAASRAAGVVHVRTRHTQRFTVVGNHLAQHRDLTLTAIGLAVHIQSLPEGARVDIKTLAARFPEGETRIASALRELEAHGYLARSRERLPSGRVVTRTVSYDRPGAVPVPVPSPVPGPRPVPEPVPRPRPAPQEQAPPPATPLRPVPKPAPPPAPEPKPAPAAEPAAATAPAPAAEPERAPQPTLEPDPTAVALLAGLRHHDERLLLTARDISRLAPAVAAWLDRGVSPDAVRRVLTAGLPDVPRHPAGLLAHRLASLPPPSAAPPALRPPPLQNCDGCDRAFRSPEPGLCRGCRTAGAAQVA